MSERIFDVQISRHSKNQAFGLNLRGGATKGQLIYLDSDPPVASAASGSLRAHDEIIRINEIDITGQTKTVIQKTLAEQYKVILTVRRQYFDGETSENDFKGEEDVLELPDLADFLLLPGEGIEFEHGWYSHIYVRNLDLSSLSHKLGVREGDAVLRVNGIEIQEGMKIEKLEAKLSKSKTLELVLYRPSIEDVITFKRVPNPCHNENSAGIDNQCFMQDPDRKRGQNRDQNMNSNTNTMVNQNVAPIPMRIQNNNYQSPKPVQVFQPQTIRPEYSPHDNAESDSCCGSIQKCCCCQLPLHLYLCCLVIISLLAGLIVGLAYLINYIYT